MYSLAHTSNIVIAAALHVLDSASRGGKAGIQEVALISINAIS
jgi:hypothetical protein